MERPQTLALSLQRRWWGEFVLYQDGVSVVSCSWRRDHTRVQVTYHRFPAAWLQTLMVQLSDEALCTHFEYLEKCPWKVALLADPVLYGLVFSVRDLVAIKHTYYALGQLAAKVPPGTIVPAVKAALSLDFRRITPYFLDGLPPDPPLGPLAGIPPALVLPLVVSSQAIPEADREDYIHLIQSYLGFFSQVNISTSDFLYSFIALLTKHDAPVPVPPVVFKFLSMAHVENLHDLLKTVALYEYLAEIGHRIDLEPMRTWSDLTEAVRLVARDLAVQIGETEDLKAIRDPKLLDAFLLTLPDFLMYINHPRWGDLQKKQLREAMKRFLQTGSIAAYKYPEPWKEQVTRMLTLQLGSGEAARKFLDRWMTPQTVYTYDYSANPTLKLEEISRLEQLHAHVDLASFELPIPEKYRHLVTHPFTSSYYETRRELVAAGAAVPPEQTFLLLDPKHHAKVMFYKEQAEVRYDPTKPDSVFIRTITGFFSDAWVQTTGRSPTEEELHDLEDLREKIAHMIMGLTPSKDLPDLVEAVLERCHLDRKRTPIDVQDALRKKFREAILQHRRQYKSFYDNIIQYKFFRYFNDYPERKALLEAVVNAESYEAFSRARTTLLSTINAEKNENLVLASLIGDNEIAYLRKLIYTYNFQRALKLFDFIVTRETRREDPKVHDRIIHYAKLLAHIKAANQKTSGADARDRLEGFVDLLGKDWLTFDQLLKQEGTNRALEYLTAGYTLIKANRDYLEEVCRNYLNNETRRIYAKIELWDSDRFLDWITVARTVYEPHVAHQQSCMHPDKIGSRHGKTEYLMGYIKSPWVKQLYLGSKDLFDPFDENNKIRCILFLTPAHIDGKELLTLNIQHPYPLNPTKEVWRVLMEGAQSLSNQYGLPLLFPNISQEELQHAAIQTRAKLFRTIVSKRLNILVVRGTHELQQRDDYEHGDLPGAKHHTFLGEDLVGSMVTSRYWVIFPE
jgi:hypothetical protein